MRDLDTTRGQPRDPAYTPSAPEGAIDRLRALGLVVLHSASVGWHHVTVWDGCKRIAWGIGATRAEAEAAAAAQIAWGAS